MSLRTGDISTKRYKKSTNGRSAAGNVDLDFETQRVFNAIDGQIEVSTVAQQAGVSIPVLWKAIAKLTRLGLIESEADTGDTGYMGKPFANKLHQELTKAVGPMSNVLIKNVVQVTNITWPNIPRNCARELIYRLVVQIPSDGLKENFQKTMLKEI